MFECTHPGCGAKLKYKKGLDVHMRRHAGIHMYNCPYCYKGISSTATLKQHLHTHHTGRKGYHCVTCSLEFQHVNHLKAHLDKADCCP